MTTRIGNSSVPREPETCRFCVTSSFEPTAPIYNRPLLESPNFYVVPTLGSLVEGWLLVVPKNHFIAAAAMPSHLIEELWAVSSKVRDALTTHFGPVWLFEHGPASENRAVGCGVDHAHVHLVPIDADLIAAAQQFLPSGLRFERAEFFQCQNSWQRGSDYLYAEPPGLRSTCMVSAADLGSQVFRKAIAQICGRPDNFDWRSNSGLDNIRSTIARLGPIFEGIHDSDEFRTVLTL